jgi:hypothetical protein
MKRIFKYKLFTFDRHEVRPSGLGVQRLTRSYIFETFVDKRLGYEKIVGSIPALGNVLLIMSSGVVGYSQFF